MVIWRQGVEIGYGRILTLQEKVWHRAEVPLSCDNTDDYCQNLCRNPSSFTYTVSFLLHNGPFEISIINISFYVCGKIFKEVVTCLVTTSNWCNGVYIKSLFSCWDFVWLLLHQSVLSLFSSSSSCHSQWPSRIDFSLFDWASICWGALGYVPWVVFLFSLYFLCRWSHSFSHL